MIALQAGRTEAAIELISKAVRIKSNSLPYLSLGNAFKAQGKLETAMENYRLALSLKPDFFEAYYNLGTTLKELGNSDAAIENFCKTLSIKPDCAEAYNNLGLVLQGQNRLNEAIENFNKALSCQPGFAEALSNMGTAYKDQGNLDAAIACYRKALAIRPDLVGVHNNLGATLRDQGQISAAVDSYRKALALRPDYAPAFSNLLYLHAFARDISPEEERKLATGWEKIILPDNERAAARNLALSCSSSLARAPRAGRKLKVGIVSAELCQHAVAEFLEPFLEQLDRDRFHLTLYPSVNYQGARAARFKELADNHKPVAGTLDKVAAELIRADQIDILIDTTGHMNGCRLGIFAHRAAPVQCHYIGYHGTTGLTEMDWYIADNTLLPPAYDVHFCERIWRLPRLRLAYRGNTSLPESRWAPSPDGIIWLGSFNNLAKVREQTLGLWAKAMNALPESKLLLKDSKAVDRSTQQRIKAELARHGIGEERIEFMASVPDWSAHMALYDRLDIALDTLPLNSETTAFDALWMGVPLVALEGNWVGGRQASTILYALGKPEWVARNEDEYVKIVTQLARDAEGRKQLRTNQRSLMAASPLCNAKGLARALESAFEAMFDQWLEMRGCKKF